MGSKPSLLCEGNEADVHAYAHATKHELVSIKLSCIDIGKFNGHSNQWIAFKEKTLSKTGVGGYAKYFKSGFIEKTSNAKGITEYSTYFRWPLME
jgi:hypothetical protein